MAYDVTKAVIDHDGTVSRVTVPVTSFHHTERIAGQRFVGAFQPGVSRVGGRFMAINSVIFELRGQVASADPTPEENIFEALGFATTGTTGFTYTLGDPHENSDTPAGDLDRIDTLDLNIDGLEWQAEECVADASFLFRAGDIPTMTCSFVGLVPDPAPATIPLVTAGPAVVVGPLPAAWQSGVIMIGGVADLRILEIGVSLNNQLLMRKDGNSIYAHAKPEVPARRPTGHIVVEAPAPGTFAPEDLAVAGTTQVLSWVYIAGGTVFKTWTYTMTVSLDEPEVTELDGVLGYRLAFTQDPTTGPFKMVNT